MLLSYNKSVRSSQSTRLADTRTDPAPLSGLTQEHSVGSGQATASSTLSGHPTSLALNEDIRTWWSASSGRAGEWFEVDLGAVCELRAVQTNFADRAPHLTSAFLFLAFGALHVALPTSTCRLHLALEPQAH